jgi:uncharacterized protein involved in cysteine biosynthesis
MKSSLGLNKIEFQGYKRTIDDAKHTRSFIREHRLRKFYWYTGFLSISVFVGLFFLAHLISDSIINFFWYDLFDIPKVGPLDTSRLIISIILGIPIRIFLFYFHNTIVQFLGFPLFLRLANKTAQILDIKKVRLNFGDAFARMFLIQIPIMMKYLFWMFVFYLLTFVPFMGWYFSYRGFMTSSYYTGFAIGDYYNELNGIRYKDSKKWIKAHEGYASAVGSIGNVLLLIPIVGIIFSPVISTVAAGLAYQKILEEENGFVFDKKQLKLLRKRPQLAIK